MEDLIQCSTDREDFQRWLDWGNGPMTVYSGEKAVTMLTRLGKNRSADYLYRCSVEKDGSISWDNRLTFCGVHDLSSHTLYLTEDAMIQLTAGQYPMVTRTGSSAVKELRGKINQRVEDIIANDRNNLPVREVTGEMALRNLRHYQEYGAKEDAIRQFFDGKAPDGQFHSGYTMDELQEPTFLAYLQDPEGFIQTEAEKYIKTNQQGLLIEFIENDALLAAYQALMQDTGNPVHKMKAITDAVKASGGKTVNVTIQKADQELTFKAETRSLTGYKNCYSTYDIPASDRRKFEKLFGRHADYAAEDITRITYGRNTIYEAASAQAEELAEETGMGIQFG